MVLSGVLIGFIGVFSLLMASLLLAVLDRREKGKGNVQKSQILSRVALVLFLVAFVGGVIMTLVAGVQPRKDDGMAAARSQASAKMPAMPGAGMIKAAPEAVDPAEFKALQDKVAQDPNDTKSRERLGHLYLKQRDFNNVFKMAHEVLQINPDSAESRAHMGMVLFAMQKVEPALQQLDIALQINPKHLESLMYKGMVQFMGLKDSAGARETWNKYLELSDKGDPGRAQVKMFLGMLDDANEQ